MKKLGVTCLVIFVGAILMTLVKSFLSVDVVGSVWAVACYKAFLMVLGSVYLLIWVALDVKFPLVDE